MPLMDRAGFTVALGGDARGIDLDQRPAGRPRQRRRRRNLAAVGASCPHPPEAIAEFAGRLHQLLRRHQLFLVGQRLRLRAGAVELVRRHAVLGDGLPYAPLGDEKIEINGFILIWPSLTAMPFAPTFLPMLPIKQPLIPTNRASAGPVVPTSAMSSFSASSPKGVQTFQAKLYAPWGPSPLSGVSTSSPGIQYDMLLYSWWYNF